jgi:hypothetical protein
MAMRALAEGCPANSTPTRPRALLAGSFCNDGTSTGPTERSGDVVAGHQKLRDSVDNHLLMAFISRGADASCPRATDGLASMSSPLPQHSNHAVTEAPEGESMPRPSNELERQIEAAFDYRGHVTITFKTGEIVAGYMFNRQFAHPKLTEEPFIEVFLAGSGERRTYAIATIQSVALTGKDYAAG